jgi:hypothetical protein
MQDFGQDWAFESSRVQDYYQNSMLCIALDDTLGDNQGFLSVANMSSKDAIAIPSKIDDSEKNPMKSGVAGCQQEYFYVRKFPKVSVRSRLYLEQTWLDPSGGLIVATNCPLQGRVPPLGVSETPQI